MSRRRVNVPGPDNQDRWYAMTDDNHSGVRADAYFAIIPEWVLDAGVSPSAVVVYLTLARYANRQTRSCYPSKETLSEKSGLSANTVSRCLSELRDIGAITSRRRNVNGVPTSNIYILHMAGPNGVAAELVQDQPLIPKFEPLIPKFEADIPNFGIQTRQSNQTKRTRNISSSSDDDGQFDQFWAIYPRKVGKGVARKAWIKALKETPAEQIISGAEQYARQRAGEDPKYTAHPSSWLAAERWMDEPDPKYLPKSKNADRLKGALERLAVRELGA